MSGFYQDPDKLDLQTMLEEHGDRKMKFESFNGYNTLTFVSVEKESFAELITCNIEIPNSYKGRIKFSVHDVFTLNELSEVAGENFDTVSVFEEIHIQGYMHPRHKRDKDGVGGEDDGDV